MEIPYSGTPHSEDRLIAVIGDLKSGKSDFVRTIAQNEVIITGTSYLLVLAVGSADPFRWPYSAISLFLPRLTFHAY